MKRETILVALVALLVGLLSGFLLFSKSGERRDRQEQGQPQGSSGAMADYTRRIAETEGIVAREPANLKAWVSLGNDYFDTDQPQKAIKAYARALEIRPDTPDVLTDQGIMFRRVGWYDRALDNFQRARKVDPRHLQSLYNMGIVYALDLKQPDRAVPLWKAYLRQDNSSDTARRVRELLDKLDHEAGHPEKKR